jgi:hypothetical protein
LLTSSFVSSSVWEEEQAAKKSIKARRRFFIAQK